jgi:hypothetical protein
LSAPHTLLLALSLLFASVAPFQCGSEPPPVSGEREDTPGEALKRLADELGKSGDREGRKKTLKFLIERYPRSREAKEAEVELAELGGAPSMGASASASAAVSSSAPP